MAFDYSEVIALAAELVAEFAEQRIVTLVELADSVSDPTQPWLGNTSPRTTPARTLELPAVFVDPSRLDELGKSAIGDDFLLRCEQIAIIASTEELKEFDEIIDYDLSRWKIERISTLKPGTTAIVHYVGVRR